MKASYHIEYDLPLDPTASKEEIVKTLAGYMDYIMDDIIWDQGLDEYQLQFYYLVHQFMLNRIIKLEQQKMEEYIIK